MRIPILLSLIVLLILFSVLLAVPFVITKTYFNNYIEHFKLNNVGSLGFPDLNRGNVNGQKCIYLSFPFKSGDGINNYARFVLYPSYKFDGILFMVRTPIPENYSKSAQQGDAPAPASPAR